MKINWKVRFKNPVFIVQIIIAVFLPMLAYYGLQWEDMTRWETLGRVMLDAVQNPVIVVAVVMSVWNAVNDPTTKGLSDSDQARSYIKPR